MASEISTIQSLKAVDAWIDVINANINGGVRTAFKSSRLKFAGSNVDVARAGSSTSLPLQFPEAGLTTANTVIDFTQGAITASTENSHLAIQGEGFFGLVDAGSVTATGAINYTTSTRFLFTRDGEFRTNQNGLLQHSSGCFLVTGGIVGGNWNAGVIHTVYNNLDTTANGAGLATVVRLSDFVGQTMTAGVTMADGAATLGTSCSALVKITNGRQSLQYTSFGSTIFDAGYQLGVKDHFPTLTQVAGTSADATILSKSLEASNASMTQSVPELSLAQKLFSALTKVLQTKQTNVDGVLNLVR
jgi:flagellar hook protein FlgE